MLLSERPPIPNDVGCKNSNNSRPHSHGKYLLEQIEREGTGHDHRNSSDDHNNQTRDRDRGGPIAHRQKEQPGNCV